MLIAGAAMPALAIADARTLMFHCWLATYYYYFDWRHYWLRCHIIADIRHYADLLILMIAIIITPLFFGHCHYIIIADISFHYQTLLIFLLICQPLRHSFHAMPFLDATYFRHFAIIDYAFIATAWYCHSIDISFHYWYCHWYAIIIAIACLRHCFIYAAAAAIGFRQLAAFALPLFWCRDIIDCYWYYSLIISLLIIITPLRD
jgi:hypothetical protein